MHLLSALYGFRIFDSVQYPGNALAAVAYNALTGANDVQNVYAKLRSSGASAPPGTYTDSYPSDAQAAIANDSSPTGNAAAKCTGNSGGHPWNTTAFTVGVIVLSSCSVSASPVNFGAATNLSVTCTFLTPYAVSLSAGNGPGATTTTGAMSQGSAEVFYSFYQDSARSQTWGNALGVDAVAGTGTGAAQSVPVYGRVPPQTTPTIGSYSDTVVVTVNY